jgi:hypothetical protein
MEYIEQNEIARALMCNMRLYKKRCAEYIKKAGPHFMAPLFIFSKSLTLQ